MSVTYPHAVDPSGKPYRVAVCDLCGDIAEGPYLSDVAQAAREHERTCGLHYAAVLSSTVLPVDGTYRVTTVPFPVDLTDVPHYVGHPATRALLEARGAVYQPGRFAGLDVGEQALAVPLAQNVRPEGRTVDTAIESVAQLVARRIERLA